METLRKFITVLATTLATFGIPFMFIANHVTDAVTYDMVDKFVSIVCGLVIIQIIFSGKIIGKNEMGLRANIFGLLRLVFNKKHIKYNDKVYIFTDWVVDALSFRITLQSMYMLIAIILSYGNDTMFSLGEILAMLALVKFVEVYGTIKTYDRHAVKNEKGEEVITYYRVVKA